MGFVMAGDWLELVEGKLQPEEVREICGKCGLKHLLLTDHGLVESLTTFPS